MNFSPDGSESRNQSLSRSGKLTYARKRGVPAERAPGIEKIKFMRKLCQDKNKPKHEMVISVGWVLALRLREIAGLKVSDFDFWEQVVYIRTEISKGRHSQGYVPIIDYGFIEQLKSYISQFGLISDDFLLSHGKGRNPYSTRRINYMVHEAGKWAGEPELHPHLLRHSRAKWLLEKGYNYRFVQAFLRHSDPLTTLRTYARFSKEDILRQAREGEKADWEKIKLNLRILLSYQRFNHYCDLHLKSKELSHAQVELWRVTQTPYYQNLVSVRN